MIHGNRSHGTALEAPASLRSLPGRLRIERLDNGLTVCLLANAQAPVVTSALFYRVGTRDEPPGHGGVAHFLEHMMFKGSARFGPGEIDRLTQALGGVNNAFTSHDSTAYYFNFAADRWTEALTIEADRMANLTLSPDHVASERQVILEEIAMYESEPWDALEMAVHERLFRAHPYGRQVLGTREELQGTGPEALRDFHDRFYRPDNAVLVVAGDLGEDGEDALDAVGKALGGLSAGADQRRGPNPPVTLPSSIEPLERRKGEVARLLLALPAPPGSHPDHGPLRLAATVLGGGRTSRLQHALVEDEQLCVWVTADLSEGLDASLMMIAAEVVPGVEPARVEARVLELVEGLRQDPPGEEEIERCRRIASADWVFGHEKVHQQALSVGLALTLFDLDYLDRHMERLLETDTGRLLEVADRWLRPERGSVMGWSLPKS
ncbi:MAG TPA: pitrilysin family protein [Thermoanaerobaculia bacterium]|jgi:zinc protease|nr:pitrilysin family protein [Thermoanaerobaculia bacterium]